MTAPFPTIETFAGHEGEAFTVDGTVGLAVTLTSVTTWGQPFGDGFRQPFTLQFHGPLEPFLPQRTYRVGHHFLGEIEVFLVPLGPDQSGMRYESVFA